MNNLVEFIKKYFHYLLFIILQIISIILIYNNINYPRFVIAKISKNITTPFNTGWNNFTRHLNLNKENEYLMQQNIKLMRETKNNFIFQQDSLFTVDSINDRSKKIRLYDYTYANVIYNTTNKKHNYLILDKGSNDGITIDMAVLSAQGVVGVVNDVSTNFCTVMSLLHPDTRISAKVMPINQIGTVIWEENNPEYAYLNDIPQHLKVNVGDSVFTSGFSNVFPENILIGIVKEKNSNPKNSFLSIKIKLATKFNNINRVYLVTNLYKQELDSLKSNLKNE